MQDLWSLPGLPEEVRNVQDLFPTPGFTGRDSRCYQVELVE
jgi:hypothetical protein